MKGKQYLGGLSTITDAEIRSTKSDEESRQYVQSKNTTRGVPTRSRNSGSVIKSTGNVASGKTTS